MHNTPLRKTTSLAAIMVAVVSVTAGFAAVYGTLGQHDNKDRPVIAAPAGSAPATDPPADKSEPLPSGPGANPLSTGEMTAFVFKTSPAELPEIRFVDGSGAAKSLADWRGKVVLLNLWATWCAPCRTEMPSLDRLQHQLGALPFEVVALGVDRTGIAGARKFFEQTKVHALKIYNDPTAKIGTELKVVGMPTTLLIDPAGREIGRLVGPAEWDAPEAKRLIEAALRTTQSH